MLLIAGPCTQVKFSAATVTIVPVSLLSVPVGVFVSVPVSPSLSAQVCEVVPVIEPVPVMVLVLSCLLPLFLRSVQSPVPPGVLFVAPVSARSPVQPCVQSAVQFPSALVFSAMIVVMSHLVHVPC